ncbi:hypothetical protein [Actinoplanes sp. CA-252034]|uniref:hypothetical protein n=1 Tax=Actinoplanes sp. CA-252034 TaxID=3239906 RepID=UPI003D98F18A
MQTITDPATPARTTVVLGRATAAVNRGARRRPALSAMLVVAGLGAIVVSVAGPGAAAPEFRTPTAVVTGTPSVQVSAAAVYTGLAPYAPPAPAEGPLPPSPRISPSGVPNGSPSPVPSVTDENAAVLSGVRELPSEKAPTGAVTRTFTDPTGAPSTAATASITLGEPRGGETVTAATVVSGTADMPDDHQVWLLSRHGAGAYRVEGPCRGGRSFTCGPVTLDSGGDDTFLLTTVVVDPATARTLQAGETRDSLPVGLAHSEVTVRRSAA